jgi:7,8-dihydropterin-6-yl-methyl-4-(beta-D-ribofuranosyl)aminobenzene 5'-phosphate synthase
LPKVLSVTGSLPVFCHRDVFLERWWIRGDAKREIGIRYKRSWLESIGADFRFVSEFTEIAPGIFLTGEVPRKTDFEPPDDNMKIVSEDGELIQDNIVDDISMVIDCPKGLVVVLGCAHAGLINILEYVHSMLPGRPFYAVVGGTHLGFAGVQQFEATVNALDDFDVKILGASHCTGLANSARLYNRLGDRFFFASAGSVMEV